MALSDAYATAAQYRDRVGRDSSADDPTIDLQLGMTSRWWDAKLRRGAGFNKDASPVARRYYVHRSPQGCGSETLFVDDIATASGLVVTIGGVTVASSVYELWPLNAALGPEAQPYDRIMRVDGTEWPFGELITVTAFYGWPAVPAGIVEATIEWTAIWRGESVRTTARVNELDQVANVSPYHLSQLKRITGAYQQMRAPWVDPARLFAS